MNGHRGRLQSPLEPRAGPGFPGIEIRRMAWGHATLDLSTPPPMPAEGSGVEVWSEFLSKNDLPDMLLTPGFCAVGQRVPYYQYRLFRSWLRKRFGSVLDLNRALGTTFRSFQNIEPPYLSLVGGNLDQTPPG